jgi:signal transduction histidine kinase
MRDEQARAAAMAERGRIASELHDAVAHSLSGAAIQLQGRASLPTEAPRRRVSARRSSVPASWSRPGLPTPARPSARCADLAQLPSLIDSYRTDMDLDVTLRIEAESRTLAADPSLALYRGAQEALTNVARYAPGACTTVTVRAVPVWSSRSSWNRPQSTTIRHPRRRPGVP